MNASRISIIIPTLNEEQYLEATLKNLSALGTMSHEIIISDGNSKDKTLEVARRYTDKITVYDGQKRQTFGEAKNAGALLANGEFFVYIDADVIIPAPQEFFKTLLREFERNPKLAGVVVPLKPMPDNPSLADRFFSAPLNWFYILSNNILHMGNGSGEFQMFRASDFKKIKGYREDLSAGEDNDVFRRLGHVGRTLSYWRLEVYHSYRRPHKVGWLKLYGIWIRNGFSVALLDRSAFKEWTVIR